MTKSLTGKTYPIRDVENLDDDSILKNLILFGGNIESTSIKVIFMFYILSLFKIALKCQISSSGFKIFINLV